MKPAACRAMSGACLGAWCCLLACLLAWRLEAGRTGVLGGANPAPLRPRPLLPCARSTCTCPFGRPGRAATPAGVVVLPVQTYEWLNATVHLDDTAVDIRRSKTDYIFIPEAAWAKCKDEFGAELHEGWKLRVTNGTPVNALQSMIGSIIALYEAKTEKRLTETLRSVFGQALIEYLAANHMKGWPKSECQLACLD